MIELHTIFYTSVFSSIENNKNYLPLCCWKSVDDCKDSTVGSTWAVSNEIVESKKHKLKLSEYDTLHTKPFNRNPVSVKVSWLSLVRSIDDDISNFKVITQKQWR